MEHTQHSYLPTIGQCNRYENAHACNRKLAEDINKKASFVAYNAASVLEKVRRNPQVKYLHDAKTDGAWAGQWLITQREYILDLYGVVQLTGLSNIPSDVRNFTQDVYTFC